MSNSDLKSCTRCGESKPRSEYYFKANGVRAYAHCKSCHRILTDNWRAKNRLKHNAYMNEQNSSRRLGISVADWKALHASAPKGCEVCGDEVPKSKYGRTGLHIDHDHATGYIRGFLCTDCNHALGMAKDNPETLRALAKYLERAKVEQTGSEG